MASPHPILGATWVVVRALLSWLVLVCVSPYVSLLAHCALVCGYVCGQGLRFAPRGSGARVHCRALLCAAMPVWASIALASLWLVLVFIAVRVGVRILPHGQGLLALRRSGARVYVRCDVVCGGSCSPHVLSFLRGTALCRRREYTFNFFQYPDVVGCLRCRAVVKFLSLWCLRLCLTALSL